MTDSEVLTLVRKLEQCQLGGDEFHHRDHIAVAVAYLYGADLEGALDKLRATLLRFSAFHNASHKYHETLTRFWLEQVEQRLDRSKCLAESVAAVQAELADKELPNRFYTNECLNSAEAKKSWVPPDIQHPEAD